MERERNGGAAAACEENNFLYHDNAQVDEDERMRRKTVTGSLAAWPHWPEKGRGPGYERRVFWTNHWSGPYVRAAKRCKPTKGERNGLEDKKI